MYLANPFTDSARRAAANASTRCRVRVSLPPPMRPTAVWAHRIGQLSANAFPCRMRKIKEIDFGFSFGLSAFDDAESAESATLPQPSAPVLNAPTIIAKPQSSDQPFASSQESQVSLPESKRGKVYEYRSPGSRSDASERPSLFDIPEDDDGDDVPAPPRSVKRRKLGVYMVNLFLALASRC